MKTTKLYVCRIGTHGLSHVDIIDMQKTMRHGFSLLQDYEFVILMDRSWDGIEIYDPASPFILNTKHDVKLLKQKQDQIYDLLLTYIENEELKLEPPK